MEKVAKIERAAQEEARKDEEEKKAVEQQAANKRKSDFVLNKEEWLFQQAKDLLKNL